MKKLSLLSAVAAFCKANVSAERAYVHHASPILAKLHEEFEPREAKQEWRKLNRESYAKLGLKKGDPRYNQLSKLASMLFAVSLEAEDVFEQYCKGAGQSLQLVYQVLRKDDTRKVAAKKPKTFRDRLLSLLRNASARERSYAVHNIKHLVELSA